MWQKMMVPEYFHIAERAKNNALTEEELNPWYPYIDKKMKELYALTEGLK